MTLVSRATTLRDRLLGLPVRFGLPQYRLVNIHKQSLAPGEIIPTTSTLALDAPLPKVQNVPSKLVGQIASNNNSIIISQDDWLVEVSRSYTLTELTEDINHYELVGIGNARLIHVDQNQTLYWNLILRLKKDGT